MKKHFFHAGMYCLLVSILCYQKTVAQQFTVGAQLRTRTEFRDGQGAPLPAGSNPALFTSQRSRLMFGFTGYRLKVGFTVQDVRVWGQDVSTINRTTTADYNGLMVHEAWAEILLTDTIVKNASFSLKIGRQEFVYDDSRLLGNLDWLQQGRRHDAALFKYEAGPWMLHVAGAFNQNKENASGTAYNETPPGNYTGNTNGGAAYKGLEFAYLGRKLKAGNISFLFLADQFSNYKSDSTGVKTYGTGTWNRMTSGIYFNKTWRLFNLTASAYYQFGHNANGQTIDGELLSAVLLFNAAPHFSIGPGVDYTSGGSNGKTTHAFDPLYGTPHKFWGAMDYFYVASGFGNHGLQDYYIRSKWKPSAKWNVNLDAHQFMSASAVAPVAGHNYDRKFGTEADLQATYVLTKAVSFEGGYSHFWSTNSLTSSSVKNVANAKSNSNWAYLMIIIRPELAFK